MGLRALAVTEATEETRPTGAVRSFADRVPWLLLTVVLLYVVERLVIALGSGHLMFHLDAGEYTPMRAVGPFLDRSLVTVLLDPSSRAEFFAACTAPPHGPSITPTLVVAGGLVHFVTQQLGAPLGSFTMRMLSLAISSAALVFWLAFLLRAGLGRSASRRFALLFLLAPPIFLKVTLIFWGSHELVVLIVAVVFLLLTPWLSRPATPGLALVQSLCVGLGGAVLSVGHGILVLPSAFVGLWLAMLAVSKCWRERGRLYALCLGLGMGSIGVASFLLGFWALVQLPTLQAMGLEPAFFANNDFAAIAQGSVAAGEVLGSGMLPGDRFSSWALIQEGPLWLGLLCAVLLLAEGLLAWLRGQGSGPAENPVVSFLAGFMLFGWVVIGAVPEEFSETRYLILLYPVSFALVAAWSLGRRPLLRLILPALLMAAQVPSHAALIEPNQLDVGLRYDGTRLYFALEDDDFGPPRSATRLGGASRDFSLGMRFIRELHWNNSYWQWHSPAEVRAMPHEALVDRYLGEGEGVDFALMDVAEFARGLGYAYRLLLPPPHRQRFEQLLEHHPDLASWMREGYEMGPEQLSWSREREPLCPPGMLYVDGGSFLLGEWDLEAYGPWSPDFVVQRAVVELTPFCMDRFPFPGQRGAAWPRDGLDLALIAELERQLAPLGRRICTVGELLLAAAGPSNQRYPSAAKLRPAGHCDARDEDPAPLGSYPRCVSPLGFHDFLVRASWARLDEQGRALLTAQGAHHQPGFAVDYLVVGGMMREDSIQAPTNFGVHIHQPEEPAFVDDGLRLCADPGTQNSEQQLRYEEWLSGYFERRYFKDLLGLTQGR
ncbi:MAG: hypothetical protein CMP23_15835 [Rickettsiales bacterium]|nr:hypothetical protein [Rickettsiales bacterium]